MANQQLAPRQPVVLVILDGFGVNPCPIHNGVIEADTPRLDEYFSRYPLTVLQASGNAVGLPDGQMGNSEVGHLTLGCGQITRQDLVAIDDAIENGEFFKNAVLLQTIAQAKQRGRPLHLVGLVSDGGVHSHVRHVLALIKLCAQHAVRPALHMITDGRDTPPQNANTYLSEIEAALVHAQGAIATVCGRYYAMDRDHRWERIEKAWKAMVRGAGNTAMNAQAAIEQAYNAGQTDEFIEPTIIRDDLLLSGDNDVVLFFNFRKDRARQLTSALFKEDFTEFERGKFQPAKITCMTEYDEWFKLPFAFCQDRPHTNLAEIISEAGYRQFHCAETEKYAHVTYFFNGRRGDAYPGEDRGIVPSPKVATYDLAPAMSAAGVANEVVKALESNQYSFIVVNFANGDMVGHTGVHEAILRSVHALDREVGRVLDAAVTNGYSVILIADHGNCEETVDYVTGAPHTQHTVFPVPCLVIDEKNWQLAIGAGLNSVAPTVLLLMGLKIPPSMTGKSLLLK